MWLPHIYEGGQFSAPARGQRDPFWRVRASARRMRRHVRSQLSHAICVYEAACTLLGAAYMVVHTAMLERRIRKLAIGVRATLQLAPGKQTVWESWEQTRRHIHPEPTLTRQNTSLSLLHPRDDAENHLPRTNSFVGFNERFKNRRNE